LFPLRVRRSAFGARRSAFVLVLVLALESGHAE
jgi:hypothetical protein